VVHFFAFRELVNLGRGVATNVLHRGATLPHFLSSERVKVQISDAMFIYSHSVASWKKVSL